MDPANLYDLPPQRTGAAPQLDLPAAGLNKNIGATPQWFNITPALIRWLQQHFSIASNIEDANLIKKLWVDGPSSPILITSLADWKPEQSNQRPAILIDRLEQNRDPRKDTIGGGQAQGVRPGNFTIFYVGAHVVHIIGGREGEADTLAKEVSRELSRFAAIVAPRLCLNRMRMMGVGKRVELTDHKQIYTVPIMMSYEYMEQFRVYPTDEAEVVAILSGITITQPPAN